MSEIDSTESDIEDTWTILVEGLDGTGKSTLCQKLNDFLPDCELWHAPSNPEAVTNFQIRTWYEHACTMVPMGYGNIIYDRWWPSTLAFTEAYYENSFEQKAQLFCSKLEVPDIVFYLKCGKATSCERIVKRDDLLSPEEKQLYVNAEFREKVEFTLDRCIQILKEQGARVIHLNTDHYDSESLFERAKEELE